MSELDEAVIGMANQLNIDVKDITVVPHESGVWGNTLYELSTSHHHFLHKCFNSFETVNIAYNPPNIPVHRRLEISVNMQNMALEKVQCSNISIPRIRLVLSKSFVMDYIEEGSNIKKMLDNGHNITGFRELGKALAQLHNSCDSFQILNDINEMYLYKLSIQYSPSSIEGLSKKEKNLYKELHAELLNSQTDFVLIHGDFNGKNVVVKDSGEMCIIDFEHSGCGKKVYDLAYFVADIMISAVASVEKELCFCNIYDFLSSYIRDTNKCEEELRSLWNHVGVQLLYRLTGPPSLSWTGFFSNEKISKIDCIGRRMLGESFDLNSLNRSLEFFWN
ncbi:TPA: aminoglycoside phosphotransferase family protein [Enterococcus faecium]|nr:aminoglycoside phosphotransferase family protein [Enterococcus faecium]